MSQVSSKKKGDYVILLQSCLHSAVRSQWLMSGERERTRKVAIHKKQWHKRNALSQEECAYLVADVVF